MMIDGYVDDGRRGDEELGKCKFGALNRNNWDFRGSSDEQHSQVMNTNRSEREIDREKVKWESERGKMGERMEENLKGAKALILQGREGKFSLIRGKKVTENFLKKKRKSST